MFLVKWSQCGVIYEYGGDAFVDFDRDGEYEGSTELHDDGDAAQDSMGTSSVAYNSIAKANADTADKFQELLASNILEPDDEPDERLIEASYEELVVEEEVDVRHQYKSILQDGMKSWSWECDNERYGDGEYQASFVGSVHVVPLHVM